jgi:GABA(A) receptor-associated protein
MAIEYKKELTFEKRKLEATRILTKFPNLIPIICERAQTDQASLPDLDRRKFLVPPTLTMGQFVYVVRKRIVLDSSQAIFMFISNNLLVPTSMTVSAVYHEHKEDDGFLYMLYSGEDTFG